MQVFHTAGVPPRGGSTILPTIGCTRNRSVAPANSVSANAVSSTRVGTGHLRGGRAKRYLTRGRRGLGGKSEGGPCAAPPGRPLLATLRRGVPPRAAVGNWARRLRGSEASAKRRKGA